MSTAIYIPGNDGLLAALDGLPADLLRYRDHAAFWVSCAAAGQWTRADEDNGPTRLHSLILRKYIPSGVVRPLREYLKSKGIFICDRYLVGEQSIGYQIAPAFQGLPLRYPLANARLTEKILAWKETTIKSDSNTMLAIAARRKPVTDSMIQTLDGLTLDGPVRQIEQALRGRGIDPGHLRYALDVIANGDHDGLVMDPFGWRVHTILTNTTAAIRPYIRSGGEALVELDVSNAQPLMLAAAFREPARCATYVVNAQHNGGETPRSPSLLGLFGSVDSHEVSRFVLLCESGKFYEALMHQSREQNRDRVKHAVFRDVLFGKVYQHGPVTDAFKALWPGIYGALVGLKRECGYKIVSQLLQRMESSIMIDGVCRRIVAELPGVRFATIHDAALVVAQSASNVLRLIEAEFGLWGVRPTVKQKNLANKEYST